MSPEASTHSRLRWHVGRWLLGLALAACAWLGWREYDYRAAVREAEAAGYRWKTREPFDLILADWHAALQKATWTDRYRMLELRSNRELPARRLIRRLRPTRIQALGCRNTNLDALKGITTLQYLRFDDAVLLQNVDGLKGLTALRNFSIGECPALQNLDGLKGLPALQELRLSDCAALQNVDGIRGLSALRWLTLSDCKRLQNVDALEGLTGLQRLDLYYCSALHDLDGLRGLSTLRELRLDHCTSLKNLAPVYNLHALQSIDLSNCRSLPAVALRELRAALPKTAITFPNGSKSPPP
ncbi:MAG: leucine-rich repeat domain-containing protein [Chthoniobacter sp.]|nr:leucine-rich repeat domain-containing protein [Chthoniobacter sp.]